MYKELTEHISYRLTVNDVTLSNYIKVGLKDCYTSSQILRGRPYSGTAILFKKSLAQYETPIS